MMLLLLNARTTNSGNYMVIKRACTSPGKATYTNADIIAIEDANRTKFNTANQIAVWVYFSDGASSMIRGK
jgi:hypothetical protein